MPNTFTLTIELGNAAMSDLQDVALALINTGETMNRRAYAGEGFDSFDTGDIHDDNGNTVGRWTAS